MEEQEHKKNWHDKNYKKLLLIPVILILLSLIYLVIFYSNTGSIIKKDISLTGGTSITIYEKISSEQIIQDLSLELEELSAREIYDFLTQEQKAVIIQTKSDGETSKAVVENYLGYELNEKNSSFEFTGSTLSESFFKQLVIAIIIAFVFMAIVVFILFRSFVPSSAVVLSAFADILMTVAFINIIGIKLSSAGIVAVLMLIAYSVDTDILLTSRVLKRSDSNINNRLFGAFKTGTTMTLSSIAAVGVSLILVQSFSLVLSQIFTILLIGLAFDLVNTWITNASIIKWYALKKHG